MKINSPGTGPTPGTLPGGARAAIIGHEAQLRRLVLANLMWEDIAYASGTEVAKDIITAVDKCDPRVVAQVAIDARNKMYLRHVPLFLVRCLAAKKGNGTIVEETLAEIIQRPDELTEYVALYFEGGDRKAAKQKLSAGSKRGLARAFRKFKRETLAKYDRDDKVKLKDVLRLVHPNPATVERSQTFKGLIERNLPAPDTWEVELSAGKDKRETWERLLAEDKLGGLAFLRNLRNMQEVGVDPRLIRERFTGNFDKVLPFRFIAAAKYAAKFEPEIEGAMLRACAALPKLPGHTVILVDISGSMNSPMSAKSDLKRMDAACALAVLIREQSERATVIATAGNDYQRKHATALVPARRGFALVEAIKGLYGTLGGGGIFLTQAMDASAALIAGDAVDRVIVFTDEQDTSGSGRDYNPAKANTAWARNAYLVNVSNHKNGIGYGNNWTAHVDGFSERVIDWIYAFESQGLQ